MVIRILRLGHRRERDKRVSTHCGLVARVFGADEIVFSGEKDEKLIQSIEKVDSRWGHSIKISYEKNWRSYLKNFKGIKVHLTMYGLPFEKKLNEIRKKTKTKDLLVVIGSEKVPAEVYHLVDFNLSVSNQPHSEIAALALFLDRFFKGNEFRKKFNGVIEVKPCEKGKIVIEKKK